MRGTVVFIAICNAVIFYGLNKKVVRSSLRRMTESFTNVTESTVRRDTGRESVLTKTEYLMSGSDVPLHVALFHSSHHINEDEHDDERSDDGNVSDSNSSGGGTIHVSSASHSPMTTNNVDIERVLSETGNTLSSPGVAQSTSFNEAL